MILNSKVRSIIRLTRNSPVLVIGLDSTIFGESTIIEGNISSNDLGIVNTVNGLKYPLWFNAIMKGQSSHQIIIKSIDLIDKESQEKFYELLKYKSISNMKLPKDCTIIVTANDLKNVSETIIRLCQIVK